jgi:hypothetical protein
MSKRHRSNLQYRAIFVFGSVLSLLPASAVAGDINACKYLAVTDFTNDPYGIARELRLEAGAKGFVVALSNSDVPANDRLKMCTMSGSWSANGFGGGLTMRVVDASGSLVAEASARATAWVNANRTVRAAVSRIYSQLGYTGFNEDLYQQRLRREYPKRPTLATSEEAIKSSEPRNRVEGIWTDSDDQYPRNLDRQRYFMCRIAGHLGN